MRFVTGVGITSQRRWRDFASRGRDLPPGPWYRFRSLCGYFRNKLPLRSAGRIRATSARSVRTITRRCWSSWGCQCEHFLRGLQPPRDRTDRYHRPI